MLRMQDIMNTNVKTVKPTESADNAYNLMQTHEIHHLVVADTSGIVGVVSERDLGGKRGASLRKNQNVADLMVEKPVTAKPNDTFRQAANKLRGYHIGCLPVVENGKVKGIVTITDLLELIGRGIEHPVDQGKRYTLRRKEGKHQPYRKM